MGNIFKIKRRTTGAAGAPATIAHGELAFNEVGEAFYYGKASNASSSIGGKGEFLDKSTAQTLAGNKTFSSTVVLSSAVTVTQVTTAADTYVATTEFVKNVFSILDGGNFDDAGGGGGGGIVISFAGAYQDDEHSANIRIDQYTNYELSTDRYLIVAKIVELNNAPFNGIEIEDLLGSKSQIVNNNNIASSYNTKYDNNQANNQTVVRIYLIQKANNGEGALLGSSNTLYIRNNNGVLTEVTSEYANNGGGNNTPVTGAYYYSASSNDWYSVSNWWGDSAHTQQATTLPLSSTNVVIVDNSVEPLVSLDNASWVQPASINSGSVGITFTSQNFGNVTCSISGEATFEGNSTYNV